MTRLPSARFTGSCAAAALALIAAQPATSAEVILPFSNLQPSLALNTVTLDYGIFPSGGPGNAIGDQLGFVYNFAGNFTLGGSSPADGQARLIAQHAIQFDLFGSNYGGDGVTTFDLPNLVDRVVIGAGAGQGLTARALGAAPGAAAVVVTPSLLPPPGGGGQPFSNTQPSLTLQTLIAAHGVFPENTGATGASTFIGQIANFAGTQIPSGWLVADGSLVSIVSDPALFSIVGTTFGGDGRTNFALPDLRGRVAVGATTIHPLGSMFGQEATTLTQAEIPPGGAGLVNDDQPSFAVHYLIADRGLFPSNGGTSGGFDADLPTLGQVVAFSGGFVPDGYLAADGSLLSIADNNVLFDVLGTTYGGDGVTDFALPNLDGRAIVGAGGAYAEGLKIGADEVALTGVAMSAMPEPAGWTMMLLGLGGLGAVLRRRARGHAVMSSHRRRDHAAM